MDNKSGYKVDGTGVLDPCRHTGRAISAGCGCDVYDGQTIYECDNGKTICGYCLEDKFDELTIAEKSELMGCEQKTVRIKKVGGYGRF